MASTSTTRPSSRQLDYLRSLARQTGTTFTYPSTKAHASAEIKRLKALNGGGFTFAERQTASHSVELYTDRSLGYGSAIRDHEITGYGSSATWSRRS